MSRYFIEDAKPYQRRDFGPTAISASALKYKSDNGETKWIYFINQSNFVIGICEEDVFEQILEIEFPDNLNELTSFDGLDLDPTPEILYELFNENKNNGAANLIHYAYDLCACPTSKEDELLALGKGKYSDEIEVPILDDEEEWLEEWSDELKE